MVSRRDFLYIYKMPGPIFQSSPDTDITLPLVLSAVSFITCQSVVSNIGLYLTWGQRSLDLY